MVSQKVWDLCHADKTVSSELARDPTLAPGKVVKHLYGDDAASHKEHEKFHESYATPEDLERAYACGKWGNTRPSELFLRVYHDVLCTLEGDPMVGMTSLPLMGSSGVVPLTIIAPLPDICRHMSNCIARAKKEVFLATNYWQSSDASTLIANSLRELSRRAGERGEKVVVKIMYDRGNPKQVLKNHQPVSEEEYTGKNVRIPSPKDIPHLDLEVVNYHKPIFGTFHSKFMVVDRRLAIVQSNNIQDNDNLEMMTHLEGPIVDSIYDVCLTSWHNELKPPLPTHNQPAAQGGFPSFEQASHSTIFDESGRVHTEVNGRGTDGYPTQQISIADNGLNVASEVSPLGDTNHAPNPSSIAKTAGSSPLPEHTSTDPHFDPDISSEVRRAQSVLTPLTGESRMHRVTRHLNTTIQPDTKGNAPECEPHQEMTPLIPHPAHEPVPMAMVCRKPWGTPNHACVHTPQNAAFLSCLRNARRSVFIQTPNLNAKPLLPAILEAVRRGVVVTYFVCLGYNDTGELLPFQNGTNEMTANTLYSQLPAPLKPNLRIHNYVAKDQTRPIHNKFKQRSCHIKLLIADGHLAIQGNGNQDTQSWFHSQEVNVMIDSEEICKAWEEGLRRNQNTHLYGRVSEEDGCWRDEQGNMVEGAIGTDPGRFSWAKGVVGAVQRVRGAGGF